VGADASDQAPTGLSPPPLRGRVREGGESVHSAVRAH
jgi:hypothetical protein